MRDISALIIGSIIWLIGVIIYGALFPVIRKEPIYHPVILIYINYVLRYIFPYLIINLISGIVAGLIASKRRGPIIAGFIPLFMIFLFYFVAGVEVLHFYLSYGYLPLLWVLFALLGGYMGRKLKEKIIHC